MVTYARPVAEADPPPMDAIELPAAYAVVVERLRRAIHLGHYPVGSKLPPERTLASQLGVARLTLREAIRVLEDEGLVRTRRGATGGAFVLASPLSPEELREHVRGRRQELLAVLEFRLVNERLAARMAAERVTPPDVHELEATVDALRTSPDIGAFRQADSAFHLKIAAMSASPLLESAIADARAAMFLPLDALDFDIARESAVRGHEKVLAAIRDGDGGRAGRAMAAHIRTTTRELEAVIA
jgi:GntR family transcriptional regulator, transcriptional repressor for pyruvate dehydrogenase complex